MDPWTFTWLLFLSIIGGSNTITLFFAVRTATLTIELLERILADRRELLERKLAAEG